MITGLIDSRLKLQDWHSGKIIVLVQKNLKIKKDEEYNLKDSFQAKITLLESKYHQFDVDTNNVGFGFKRKT